jgi:hypothetical protein
MRINSKERDDDFKDEWVSSLDGSVVHVERLLAYYLQTFKDAETRYSTTKREALGAKEGLVRFEPFIERERILLVTYHSALQWARTNENTNRRLANWGQIYSAYVPGLEIVHCLGRVHSNVDPLSQLPRAPPAHLSPCADDTNPLTSLVNNDLVGPRHRQATPAHLATASFVAAHLSDCVDLPESAQIDWVSALTVERAKLTTKAPDRLIYTMPGRPHPKRQARGPRAQLKKDCAKEDVPQRVESSSTAPLDGNAGLGDTFNQEPFLTEEPPVGSGGGEDINDQTLRERAEIKDSQGQQEAEKPSFLQVGMNQETLRAWIEDYGKDADFKKRWKVTTKDGLGADYAGSQFAKDSRGLLFFFDADFAPKLCVPLAQRAPLMIAVHKGPTISAHAGAEKLLAHLADCFYWPRMRRDVNRFSATCDVCQKTKPLNFTMHGFL